VWTKYRTRADMPPAAKDFWLPLFIYPITPPATNIKGRTISSHNLLHFGRNSQHRKKIASQDISRDNAVNMRI